MHLHVFYLLVHNYIAMKILRCKWTCHFVLDVLSKYFCFDKDNFKKLYISFIFKKFCRRLNVHVNICGHVLIMYGMWNSCIFTQFCLCMCMELFHSSWSTLGTCVQKIHLYIYKYVRRDLNFFFNIILLEKLLLQKNILYIYFMDIIFSYTLI